MRLRTWALLVTASALGVSVLNTLLRDFNGDEFSIILEPPISREDALQVIASLLSGVEVPLYLAGHSIRIAASVGLAVFPDDASDQESLFVAADQDMYTKKTASRATIPTGKPPAIGMNRPGGQG